MIEKVILAGFGGQGMMLAGRLLAQASMLDGKHITFFPSYGTEVRGGTAHYHLIISTEEIYSPVVEIADTLLIMNQPSYLKFKDRLKSGGILFLNSSMVEQAENDPELASGEHTIFKIPATEIASELGNVLVSNMVMTGAYNAVKKIVPAAKLLDCLQGMLTGKKASLFEINRLAIKRGEECVLKEIVK
ncbi:MAG TPA: 2-oxoacid:acceptor oxidoreductase family protein [Candidatus Brocadiia bacterium]|nr:2-oxoacid:acceptor oxidoreductase family protein [Candidatus Brocadiales bacterium]